MSRRHRSVRPALLATAGLLASACDDGGPAAVSASLELLVEPPQLVLRPGTRARVRVTVLRGGGGAGPVILRVLDLPAGVEADAATVPEGKPGAFMELRAAHDAPGAGVTSRVEATSREGSRSQVPLEVRVTDGGEQGALAVVDATEGVSALAHPQVMPGSRPGSW